MIDRDMYNKMMDAVRTLERLGYEYTHLPGQTHIDWYLIPRHEWDGDHCVKCGDADWYATPVCSECKLKPEEPLRFSRDMDGEMETDVCGDWVLYEDYKKLMEKL